MLAWEQDERTRVIYENEHMISLSPFVPKDEFELRIYPKAHSSYIERSGSDVLEALADALRVTLAKLFKGLDDSPYSFYIHTAPAQGEKPNDHYHWHVEILPKPPTPRAGFELGTGVDVSMVDPDEVAQFLRDVAI